jgi:hypothetical protein
MVVLVDGFRACEAGGTRHDVVTTRARAGVAAKQEHSNTRTGQPTNPPSHQAINQQTTNHQPTTHTTHNLAVEAEADEVADVQLVAGLVLEGVLGDAQERGPHLLCHVVTSTMC